MVKASSHSRTGRRSSARTTAVNRGKRTKLSSHHRSGLTESAEDYLECISNLIQKNGYVSVSAVAESLDLIRPSVSLMIKRLADMGYLKREAYRGFVLTERGQEIALGIQHRHALLTELFTQMGLDPVTFYDDIEGLEHHISDEALAGFENLVGHLKSHPLK